MDENTGTPARPGEVITPVCIGKIACLHNRHCSADCPATALCVVVLMEHYWAWPWRQDMNEAEGT